MYIRISTAFRKNQHLTRHIVLTCICFETDCKSRKEKDEREVQSQDQPLDVEFLRAIDLMTLHGSYTKMCACICKIKHKSIS